MSRLDTAAALLVGPVDALEAAGRAGALLDAATWQDDRTLSEGKSLAQSSQADGAFVVSTTFDPWPKAAGEAPDLPLLTWELQEEGEPMELVLAGLDAGRRLASLGVELLIGPSLALETWVPTGHRHAGAEALAAQASAFFLQGLAAADLRLCVDGFPAASMQEITGRWRAFPHAFVHGVDAVRLDKAASSESRAELAYKQLRDELGFAGLILGQAQTPADVPRLLAAGCDWVQVQELESALDALDSARQAGRLSEKRLSAAHRRVEDFFDRPIS